jgi:2,4-dienoyl-CoA reductase-like NADH-dependent reductase (Old Yellow Enzyme family)
MRDLDLLFRGFSYKNFKIPNRIVMAPMTRSFSPNHVPTPQVAEYYRRRAAHGVGLIITEGTCIDHPASNGHSNVPFMYGVEALAGWKNVVDVVHQENCKIIPQLWHVGAVRTMGSMPNPTVAGCSPSGLVAPGIRNGHVMSQQDIEDVVESFKRAARSAMELGFDGVEIHGAHGYLIDQYFWNQTNHRTDKYGGSIFNRTRFAQEIIQAIRGDLGDDFLIVLRWSQWKMQSFNANIVTNSQELNEFLQPLVNAGVDIFHCSTHRFWEPAFTDSDISLAGLTKALSGRPTIAVGSVGMQQGFLDQVDLNKSKKEVDNLAELEKRMKKGEFDLIAIGRALIADAAWPEKIKNGSGQTIMPYDKSLLSLLE